MTHLKFIVVVSVFLLVSSPYLQASDDVDKLTNITLEQAIEKSLANNLELSAAVFETSKAQARTFQASRLPNPELSIEMEDFGGSAELRKSDTIETTVKISQSVLLRGKRKKRKTVARLEEEQNNWDLQVNHLIVPIFARERLCLNQFSSQEIVRAFVFLVL